LVVATGTDTRSAKDIHRSNLIGMGTLPLMLRDVLAKPVSEAKAL
jgi:aconitase A